MHPPRAPRRRVGTAGVLTALLTLGISPLVLPEAAAQAAPSGAVLTRAVPAQGAVDDSTPGAAVGGGVTDAQLLAWQRMTSRLDRRVGSSGLTSKLGGIVVDVASGRTVWSHRASTGLKPASLAKLTTAVTIYRTVGAGARLVTTVRQVPGAHRVYLVGVADPSLTRGAVRTLARTTAASLTAQGVTSVRVLVDDTALPAPTRPTGWKTSYTPGDVTPVRALSVAGRHVTDTALDAGRIFAKALATAGVTVTTVRRGTTPDAAVRVASRRSAPMSTLVRGMLLTSDNNYAEKLLRVAALDHRGSGTWSAARATRADVLALLGVTGVTLYDGSGLSRSDRVTAEGLATLLRAVLVNDDLAPLADFLPVAGSSGTLARRFRSGVTACAAGRVQAKTGTLNDVAALAGYAATSTGDQAVFVLVENGAPAWSARPSIDRFATTVTGCW